MEAILKKEIILNKTLCRMLGVLTFIILTAEGAFVRIPLPFTPVPITLQTFFVLLSGACLGAGLGASAQLSYIFLGILGVPLFTGTGSGLFYLFGPTSGYLLGFVLASFFTGRFIAYCKNLYAVLGLLCLADFIILITGTLWLKFLLGHSLNKLLLIGFIPFIPGDLLKAVVASLIYVRLKSRLKKIL